MVEQAGMVNHLYIMIRDLKLTNMMWWPQTGVAMFDISVWQFLAALLVGGKVLIMGIRRPTIRRFVADAGRRMKLPRGRRCLR